MNGLLKGIRFGPRRHRRAVRIPLLYSFQFLHFHSNEVGKLFFPGTFFPLLSRFKIVLYPPPTYSVRPPLGETMTFHYLARSVLNREMRRSYYANYFTSRKPKMLMDPSANAGTCLTQNIPYVQYFIVRDINLERMCEYIQLWKKTRQTILFRDDIHVFTIRIVLYLYKWTYRDENPLNNNKYLRY